MTETGAREPGQIVTNGYRRDGRLRYGARGREIIGEGAGWFNNRPLYNAPETGGVALAGDRAFVRLLGPDGVAGTFAAGVVRGGRGRWLHEWETVNTAYRCGRMSWTLADPSLPGVEARLVVVPRAEGAGFAARLSLSGLGIEDRLVWTFCGARAEEGARTRWDPVNRGNPPVVKVPADPKPELLLGFVPPDCRGNRVVLSDDGFSVGDAAARSDRGGRRGVGDASALGGPAELARSAAADLPAAWEEIGLKPGTDEIHFKVRIGPGGGSPARAFLGAQARLAAVERMRTQTPDAHLDAAVAAVCHVVDSNCERSTSVFRHGVMSWNIRFIGWRVICGATALGWHERVRANALHYAALQVKDDPLRTEPSPDPQVRLCHEGPDSRLHGRGRIREDQHFYNTQSQFFEQTIRDWRWTADRSLEAVLRPALELHLEWLRECFDPDGDGLYESYINTLPTDSVWYNGGGGVEESAYAWHGHVAAADMADQVGDAACAARHRERAALIARALDEVLWLPERGHYGLYVEQGGLRRVHADAWIYSQFLPIDAGMTEGERALQALYFTEWGLERIPLPFGGVLCQPSNWVPSKWSVRDMFMGDQCHLALAYFKAGLPSGGWELLRGSILESCYASVVPGGFSHVGAGTDFGDCAHMLARVVAEGLFGFEPDYPNGAVWLRPALPPEWPSARLEIPDVTFDFKREGDADRYRIVLARGATLRLRLPVRAAAVRSVRCNGGAVSWRAEPGCGVSWVLIEKSRVPAGEPVDLVIGVSGRLPDVPALELAAEAGGAIKAGLAPGATGAPLRDLHGVLEGVRVAGGVLSARAAAKPGHHLVLIGEGTPELPRWRVLKLRVSDPSAEAARRARTPREAPAGASWACLDLSAAANGDVREIFRQQYLSPRPRTCSVRLGADGYSAWTFPHWREGPPEIDLSGLDSLGGDGGRIRTPFGVPFARPAAGRNIAFASLWDNWPASVRVPVGRAAAAAWVLVCGSTFPMQTGIANARLVFRYGDGVVEALDLVPPVNFWSLCTWGGLDYDPLVDGYCLPALPPPLVWLGRNCRAIGLSWTLRPGISLAEVSLEALSQDVVIGIMGVTLMNPATQQI
jgi:Domain of unknown function (DUF4450)